MATNYNVNYDDKRFSDVETDKKAALNEVDTTYGNMISESDKFYQEQINASKEWADTQTKLQNEQTDFAIEQIEQQKDQAHKDYTKEQSGAYKDWQKQSDPYGVNAEQMAANGMTNTGYSESSQVAFYNTYQNRVATARESYTLAVTNYNNSIKEARLKNNAALAEIAAKALQEQLELALAGFQYKNQLILDKADKRREVENNYYTRYQDVLKQINTENALAEEVRQYNETLAENKRQYNETLAENKRQHNETLAFQREQFNYQKQKDAASSSGGSASISKTSSSKKSNVKSAAKSYRSTKNNKVYKSGVKKGSSNTSSSSSSKEPTVDMNSVLSLGYGPISASKLNNLVGSGVVKEYVENGKIKYKKVVNRSKFGG